MCHQAPVDWRARALAAGARASVEQERFEEYVAKYREAHRAEVERETIERVAAWLESMAVAYTYEPTDPVIVLREAAERVRSGAWRNRDG